MRKNSFKWISFIFLIALCFNAGAKNDTIKHESKFTVKGYIKYLEEVSFAGSATELLTNDLIHNRLNF